MNTEPEGSTSMELNLTELSEAEVRSLQARTEYELARRRMAEHAKTVALTEADDADLECLEASWWEGYQGSIREDEQDAEVLRWLWRQTVIGHEAQHDRAPSVGYVCNAITDALAGLVFAGGEPDATDLEDHGDPPSFGGRGCTCRMYDDGDGESGPHLAVDLSDTCPYHGHLAVGAVPDIPWPGQDEIDSGRLTEGGYERPEAYGRSASWSDS